MTPIAQLLMRLFGGGPDRMESMPNPVHSGNGNVVRSGTGTPVTSRFGRGSAPIEERQMMDRPMVKSMPQPMAQMQQTVPHENLRLEDIVVKMMNPNTPMSPWGRTPSRLQTRIMPWQPLTDYDSAEESVGGQFWERLKR